MFDVYAQLVLQCIIIGVALYFWVKSLVATVRATTWGSRISNFVVALAFWFAMLVVGAYWWDTIETHNTFFSQPMHKVIKIEQK